MEQEFFIVPEEKATAWAGAFSFEWQEDNGKGLEVEVEAYHPTWIQYQLVDAHGEVRLQYVSGKTPQPVYLSENADSTSPNGIFGTLPKGEWTLYVQAAAGKALPKEAWGKVIVRASANPAPVPFGESWLKGDGTFSLEGYRWRESLTEESKWYKGDFHTHTIASDGKMTREENIASAKAQELDFFVATDHNLVPTSWPASEEMLVIPGIEVTAREGHYNILGVRTNAFPGGDAQLIESESGMQKVMEAARKSGALNSINHPFLTEWKWLFKETPFSLVDAIEIWNDPTFQANEWATEQALKAWDALTNDGWKLTGIGGSDSHLRPDETYPDSDEPSLIGDPGTYVWAEKRSAQAIIDHVKQGHVYVTRGNVRLDYQVEGHLPGETLHTPSGKAQLHVLSGEELFIQWVENGKVIKETVGTNDEYVFDWDDQTYAWVRATVRNVDGTLIGFTNPVYFGQKNPQLQTWGDLLKRDGWKHDD
ncbi:CehA/McbA family metallohydrolase [Shouchella shacheensis]|uniref:CehA/McbA family metallohydrolase n=1 Tax=Shouchella shacheensis TaxID=1649580 RepID=UPI000740256D|nr:CehA/McbA family metallohydrolase [Shouchella shacheensis]